MENFKFYCTFPTISNTFYLGGPLRGVFHIAIPFHCITKTGFSFLNEIEKVIFNLREIMMELLSTTYFFL